MWSPSHYLNFFSPPESAAAAAWPGELIFFAIYNRTLSQSEVKQNFLAGLPNSLPVVISETIVVNEDGQQYLFDAVNGQIFYPDSILPLSAVSVIQLRIEDIDDKFYHPNFGNGTNK
jgi:hypothetical protein